MSQHPLNLALRFLLELAAVAALAWWGWKTGTGAMRLVLAIVAPMTGASLWGTLRVPGDGGVALVYVTGRVRLLLEAVLFGLATAALVATGQLQLTMFLAAAVIFHYALSYDRVVRLLRNVSAVPPGRV